MFDGLLKPKFYSKCKTCLKLIKTRLETIQKKRNAVQKFLKKDIAELLKDSLDYNAYGRAEGLLVEQNMSACYELIAKFVGSIYPLVKDLCKHNECPDGCKEAIPSLIYAAARFSALPELRDLRTLFTGKFGNSLEPYISKEFVEKLRQDPPSKEMKIQFLHDLAQEFSIDWNSKALEQSLYSPPQLHDEVKPQNDYVDVKWHEKNDHVNPKMDNLQRDIGIGRDYKYNTSKGNKGDSLSQGKKEYISSGTETASDNSSHDDDGSKASSSSIENENDEGKRPISYKLVPPPYYVKDKAEDKTVPERDSNNNAKVIEKKKSIGRSVRQRRPLKSPPNENADTENAKLDGDGNDEDERIIDGLLMHYSKKQSPYDNGMINRRNTISSSMRGTSLPRKETSSMETLKGHERATSLVPEEMMRTARHHVHPSLPDYEDFTARLAALRARNIN